MTPTCIQHIVLVIAIRRSRKTKIGTITVLIVIYTFVVLVDSFAHVIFLLQLL